MKLVDSNYYSNGTSYVVLEHHGKKYEGQSSWNGNLKYPPNSFFGQRLAEKRAMIKYWKEKRDVNRIKKQALESFKKDLDTYIYDGVVEEGLYELILEKLNQHIKYYGKEAKDCKENAVSLREGIKENLEVRKQLLDKF